jgi:hypothetical protein
LSGHQSLRAPNSSRESRSTFVRICIRWVSRYGKY